MTVAGSDSGAGAGIQVDLKTFAAHHVYGVSAVSAVTVQNTAEVRAVHRLSPGEVTAQIECLLDDFDVAAAKTGMLASAGTVSAVAEVFRRRSVPFLVVDPVLVSSTGTRLIDDAGIAAYREKLFPLATVVTPNIGEASVMTGHSITTETDMERACRTLVEIGAGQVVVKGGHLGGEGRITPYAVDIFFDGNTVHRLATEWVTTSNVHGTGCTFSAAITAQLANGADLATAVHRAKSYVHSAIAGGATWHLGSGHGPLDHFGWSGTMR